MPAATYLYELLGLAYYLMFLVMGSRRYRGRFSVRSRLLTVLAAIALVGSVPGRYGTNGLGVAMMLAFAAAALISAFIDSGRR